MAFTLTVVGLISCNAAVQISSPALTNWVFCANEYSGCSFVGLRDVRFVLNDKATVKSFYGGLDYCKEYNFGLTVGGSGAAKCEYASTYKTSSVQNPMPGMGGLNSSVNLPLGHPGYSTTRVQDTTDFGIASDIGAFRIPCEVSHFSFDDPIVHPGEPGTSHLHMFFGNTLTDANSTVDSMLNSGNSTCAGGILDRTAYWTPALIDGTGNVILPDSAIFYYKTGYNGIKPSDIKAIPKGLRMIAGDSSLSSSQGQGHWGCTEVYLGHLDSIQDVLNDAGCGAGKHLQLSLDFEQCWDGQNLDSSNHKSHLANPVAGACPSTHPVAIPVISFNVRFPISQNSKTQNWHLSSDMYDYTKLGGGFSAHGDWWDGWDTATEKAWIENCNNASKDCHGYLLGNGKTLY
jgi:hypothetical protein